MKTKAFLPFILVTSVFLLVGCTAESYEQSYINYQQMEQSANLRLRSWFPDIAGRDAYDLMEIHSLETNQSFGRFSYSNERRIDSLLSDWGHYEPIPEDSLTAFMNGPKTVLVPDWFLPKNQFLGKMFFKSNTQYYFILSKADSTIYFASR